MRRGGAPGLRRGRPGRPCRPARTRGLHGEPNLLSTGDHRHTGPDWCLAVTPGGGPGPGALAVRPDPAEFAALAKEHTIVPVWCEVVADTLTPVTCFANVVGEGDGFLFESVEGGERWGRYSFVGRRPLATLTARGRRVDATGRLDVQRPPDVRQFDPRRARDSGHRAQSPTPRARTPAAARGAGRLSRPGRGARGSSASRSRPRDDLGHPDAGPRRHRPVLRELRPLASAHRRWSTTWSCPTRDGVLDDDADGGIRRRLRPARSSWRPTARRPGEGCRRRSWPHHPRGSRRPRRRAP